MPNHPLTITIAGETVRLPDAPLCASADELVELAWEVGEVFWRGEWTPYSEVQRLESLEEALWEMEQERWMA